MGKARLGPISGLKPSIKPQTGQVYVDRVQVIEKPVERIVEVLKEVPVEVIKYVDRPVESVKEIEKLVEVTVPYIQYRVPYWARWMILASVIEAFILAMMLSSR